MDFDRILDNLKNKIPRNTASQLEEFKKSTVWMDICDELNAWRVNTWEELETTDEPVLYNMLRGRARCLKEMLQIIDTIIHVADITKENENDS